MTDNEIIKALECCCKNNNCEGCPLDFLTFSSQCASELAIKSLDLITRQQEEIESLKIFRGYAEKRASDYRTMRDKYLNAKSEAIKDFAERLKHSFFDNGYESPDVDFDYFVDNLVKEMVGDDNA